MKANIDLTVDRHFTKTNSFTRRMRSLGSSFGFSIQERFDFTDYREVFHTGTRTEILKKRHLFAFNSTLGCEKCGARMLPWANTYGLCQKCDDELEEQFSERKWPY